MRYLAELIQHLAIENLHLLMEYLMMYGHPFESICKSEIKWLPGHSADVANLLK